MGAMPPQPSPSWLGRIARWLDATLPAPPEPGQEPSRKDRFLIWLIRNRLPADQGRPRGGGQGGFR